MTQTLESFPLILILLYQPSFPCQCSNESLSIPLLSIVACHHALSVSFINSISNSAPYPQCCFRQQQLPAVNCSRKIVNGQFQKSVIHKFYIVDYSEEHDKILGHSSPSGPGCEPSLCSADAHSVHYLVVKSLSSHQSCHQINYQ